MRSLLLPLTLFFAGASFAQEEELPPSRSEPSMRVELENAYERWRTAMARRDLRAWEAAVPMYRRMETRNRIVSEKQPFPEALFDSPMEAPPLSNLIALDVKTRRVTASAIYFGKADFGISDPAQVKNVFLVLRFLKEDGTWFFDNIRIVRVGENTEILHQIRIGDLSFLDGEEFQPLGSVPPVAQPAKTPDLMAEAWVTSLGYETEIWINGIRLGKIGNNSGRELVMGGVNRGQNLISIETRQIPPPDGVSPRLEIAIYAAANAGEPAERVFHFGPRDKVEPSLQMGFSGAPRR